MSLVIECGIIGTVKVTGNSRGALYGHIARITQLGLARFTLTRGDKDNAIGSTNTIDGRSRCVFKNADRLYFVGIDTIIVGPFYAIDHHQRCGVVGKGTHTAYQQRRTVFAWRATALHGDKSGHLSHQHIADVGLRSLHQVFCRYRRDGTRYAGFLLCAIAYDHHFVQLFGSVFGHGDT